MELRIALELQSAETVAHDGQPRAALRADEHREKAETLTARKEHSERTIADARGEIALVPLGRRRRALGRRP